LDIGELRAELGRQNMSIPRLAEALGMNRKQLYQRFHGDVSFTQKDILGIKHVLGLSDEQIIRIFFNS